MAAIQVKNVPSELHERLRDRARDQGLTISQFVLELLEDELDAPPRKDWIARLQALGPVDGEVDVVEVIEEGRADRR